MVMLWATDFLPLWKKVSGVQILLAIRLLRGRMFIGPWNFNRSSFQLWRKKTSTVYSWEKDTAKGKYCLKDSHLGICSLLNRGTHSKLIIFWVFFVFFYLQGVSMKCHHSDQWTQWNSKTQIILKTLSCVENKSAIHAAITHNRATTIAVPKQEEALFPLISIPS